MHYCPNPFLCVRIKVSSRSALAGAVWRNFIRCTEFLGTQYSSKADLNWTLKVPNQDIIAVRL